MANDSVVRTEEVEDNIYIPSKAVLKVMAREKSNYKAKDYNSPYTGEKKALVVYTEQNYIEMENGKIFLTGNHLV